MKKKNFLKKYKWLRKNNMMDDLILWAQIGASGCIHIDKKGRTYIAPRASKPENKLTLADVQRIIYIAKAKNAIETAIKQQNRREKVNYA